MRSMASRDQRPRASARRPKLVLAALGAGLTAALTPSLAQADTQYDLEPYDVLPPNTVWQDAIRLPSVAETGRGIGVAVLDTGVTQVSDLGGRVVARMDSTPEGDGFDRYGHGTHMTGIVAGDGGASGGRHRGVATGSSVLPVKIGGWNGASDVTQALAALEWIGAHRGRYGIRVVNLSMGTDSSSKHAEDALNHAVQRLWKSGVVVVASAGNRGSGGSKIDKPADDPYVVTVGAADTRDTAGPADDVVAEFSSRGPTHDGVAKPDLVAPGISIVSHRAPGSTLDIMRPAARLDDRHTKGTGTSQSAAIVSGVAALMLQADPGMSPDEVKAALVGTANPAMRGQDGAGAGLVDAAAAVAAAKAGTFEARLANRGLGASSGRGPIDSTRGSYKPYGDFDGDGKPEQLSGDSDALGNRWDPDAWASRTWSEGTWTSSPWARVTNVSPGWSTTAWTRPWTGLGWNEATWSAWMWRGASPEQSAWTAWMWRESGVEAGNWTAWMWRAWMWR